MYQFIAWVRLDNGATMNVPIVAESLYHADQQAKAIYGADKVITVHSNTVTPG